MSTDLPEATPRGGGRLLPVMIGLVIVAALALAAVAATGFLADRNGETTTFVVPAGTAKRAAAGQIVQIMPVVVKFEIGDTMVIRNDDDEIATVGPFAIRPGETLRKTFRGEQLLKGECSLSDEGIVTIVVT